MVDFVGDILRNAYNPQAANWKAPAAPTYDVVAGSRTTGGSTATADPAMSALYDMYVQKMINQYGSNKWQRDMDGKERRYLESLRQPRSAPATTENYWTVNGTEYATEEEARAAADKLSTTNTATNPHVGADQYMGLLPGFSANELYSSGYIDNPAQAAGMVWNPVSSYNAQKAVNVDQWGDDTLTRVIMQALDPAGDINNYTSNEYLDPYMNPLLTSIDSGIRLQDAADYQYDFGGYLNENAAVDIVGQMLNKERQGARTLLDDTGGFGWDKVTGTSQYARDLYNDTLDDSFIADILGTQNTTAQNALDRALSYGQISQAGYDAGLAELGSQRTTGEAQIGDYSSGILGDYRTGTDASIGSLYGDIDSLLLGAKYDPTSAVTDVKNTAQSNVNDFEGTLRSLVGDQQFFDIGKLLAEGAKNSGIFDPVADQGLLGKLQSDDDKNQQRGLGSQGSF